MGKGTVIAVLEDMANPSDDAGFDRLVTWLLQLRAGEPLTSLGLVDSTNLPAPPGVDPLRDRLEANWFGATPDGSGGFLPQAPFADGPGQTGYFTGYHGDTEALFRETIIRTIEVSLGLDHGADPAAANRRWPVEIFWKGMNPWVEGWVTWRRHGDGPTDGQVTVVVATPADTHNKVVTVGSLPPDEPEPLPEPTTVPPDHHGMWLVADAEARRHTVDHVVVLAEQEVVGTEIDQVGALTGRPPGTWLVPVPSTTWEGVGGPRVVHVPESAGGAAPFGQTYLPAP